MQDLHRLLMSGVPFHARIAATTTLVLENATNADSNRGEINAIAEGLRESVDYWVRIAMEAYFAYRV